MKRSSAKQKPEKSSPLKPQMRSIGIGLWAPPRSVPALPREGTRLPDDYVDPGDPHPKWKEWKLEHEAATKRWKSLTGENGLRREDVSEAEHQAAWREMQRKRPTFRLSRVNWSLPKIQCGVCVVRKDEFWAAKDAWELLLASNFDPRAALALLPPIDNDEEFGTYRPIRLVLLRSIHDNPRLRLWAYQLEDLDGLPRGSFGGQDDDASRREEASVEHYRQAWDPAHFGYPVKFQGFCAVDADGAVHHQERCVEGEAYRRAHSK